MASLRAESEGVMTYLVFSYLFFAATLIVYGAQV